MKDVFDKTTTEELIQRIQSLHPDTAPKWGKMSVDQMLAHCNVTYEMAYEDTHPKPKGLKKWLLKTFIKKIVVSHKPYKKTTGHRRSSALPTPKNFILNRSV